MSKAQIRANKKWQEKNYEFIKIALKKGQKEIVKDRAKSENKSMNKYCKDKILGEWILW